jgi:hypothetical protein
LECGERPRGLVSEACFRWLRRRNSHPIARNNLRLIRENLAAARIHKDFHPVHIVVIAGRVSTKRVVAKRFDPSEVLKPPALGVEEGFVHPEVMRVAVHVRYGFLKRDDFLAQRKQEIVEAVRSRPWGSRVTG